MPIRRNGCPTTKNGSKQSSTHTNGSSAPHDSDSTATTGTATTTPRMRTYTFPPSEPRFYISEDNTLESHHVVEYLQEALSSSSPEMLTSLSCEGTVSDDTIVTINSLLQQNHHNVRLSTLQLPKNQLTAAAVEPLASITQIMAETLLHLDLTKNNIGIAGLPRLIQPLITPQQPPVRLQTLNLVDNNLTRKASYFLAELLRKNTTLQALYLGHNPLKPQGIRDIIAGGLAQNPDSQLHTLDLKATSMGGKGAGLKALLEYLHGNETIHTLDLSYNNMKAAGVKEFASILTYRNQIHDLNLGCNDIGPKGVVPLAHVLNENGALQGFCHIQRLALPWNQLGDEGTIVLANNAIQNNSTLQHLDLSNNNIGLEGVTQLANSLAINFSLQTVNLNGNNIDDEGAMALGHVLRRKNCHIQELTCQDNPLVSEEHGEFYLRHAFLFRESLKKELGQLQKDIEADRLMTVDWWRRPPQTTVTDWEVDVLVQSLTRHNPQLLQTIYLTGPRITDESLQPLCSNYVAENPSLQRLYLKNVTLRDDLTAMKQALCTNSTLRILTITNCDLSTTDCAANLAIALKHNSALQRLSIQGNSLGDEGFCLLWKVINPDEQGKPHPSLISINMSNNGLTDHSMEAIAKSGSVGNLKELYLEKNEITDRGALDLAKALIVMTNLNVLSVAHNEGITSRGQIALRAFAPRRFSC